MLRTSTTNPGTQNRWALPRPPVPTHWPSYSNLKLLPLSSSLASHWEGRLPWSTMPCSVKLTNQKHHDRQLYGLPQRGLTRTHFLPHSKIDKRTKDIDNKSTCKLPSTQRQPHVQIQDRFLNAGRKACDKSRPSPSKNRSCSSSSTNNKKMEGVQGWRLYDPWLNLREWVLLFLTIFNSVLFPLLTHYQLSFRNLNHFYQYRTIRTNSY
jgi:hypothetical protein